MFQAAAQLSQNLTHQVIAQQFAPAVFIINGTPHPIEQLLPVNVTDWLNFFAAFHLVSYALCRLVCEDKSITRSSRIFRRRADRFLEQNIWQRSIRVPDTLFDSHEGSAKRDDFVFAP